MKWYSFQTSRYGALNFYRSLPVTSAKVISYILGLLALIVIALSPISSTVGQWLGVGLILITPGLLFVALDSYYSYLERNPTYRISDRLRSESLLNNFDFDSLEIILKLKNKPNITTLWTALAQSDKAALIFYRLGLTTEILANTLPGNTMTDADIEAILQSALKKSKEQKAPLATIFDLVGTMLETSDFNLLLKTKKIDGDQVQLLLQHYQELENHINDSHRFWEKARTSMTGGFARDWAISYTNLLDRFTQVISPDKSFNLAFSPLYSREKLIDEIVKGMGKSQGANVLLVGEAGVGKKELFYHLAEKVINGQTKSDFDRYQIRILDVQHMLSSSQSPEQLQALFEALFSEMSRAGNIILYIDRINLLLADQERLGTTGAGVLLGSYLNNQKIKVIGSITKEEYLTAVKSDSTLRERFSNIEIPSPSGEELEKILLFDLGYSEHKYQVFFLLESIKATVSLAARYLKDEASPKRELDLIEEIASTVHASGQRLVRENDVIKVVEKKAQVPIQVDTTERETLLNLEAHLHELIIGQNKAIKLISDALMRARTGLTTGKKPIGSFLFLGPTGVGKTETSKALAQVYFGSVDQTVRLDMTEYADQEALEKLLGVDPTHQPGALTLAIQEKPSSVVLLDEIEKSSAQIKNVMLQMLDEGRITTNFGKVLDFTNTIVIATSNAGSDIIKQQISQGTIDKDFEKKLVDTLISEHIFLPEFFNRFDAVVVFLPLSFPEIQQVVKLRLSELFGRVKNEKGLELEVSDQVVETLARQGYDPVFGARALDRVVKDQLETKIAREILEKQPTAGSKIKIETL